MTTMTQTKKLRVMDWDKDKVVHVSSAPGFRASAVKGALVRKADPDPAEPRRHIGDCHVCGLPVYVSKGQIINIGTRYPANGKPYQVYAHKRCRKLEKRGKI